MTFAFYIAAIFKITNTKAMRMEDVDELHFSCFIEY